MKTFFSNTWVCWLNWKKIEDASGLASSMAMYCMCGRCKNGERALLCLSVCVMSCKREVRMFLHVYALCLELQLCLSVYKRSRSFRLCSVFMLYSRALYAVYPNPLLCFAMACELSPPRTSVVYKPLLTSNRFLAMRRYHWEFIT